MDSTEFRKFGQAALDYLADYNDNIRERSVLPDVEPGYLSKLLPAEPPEKPEPWEQVLEDVERFIMPGMTHWHSPQFHAYCPASNSYPSAIGDLISAGIGCQGFTWHAAPAATELEVIVMDWLAKALGLPKEFLHSSDGPGGGCIQSSASEATLLTLLAARNRTIKRILRKNKFEQDEYTVMGKLVAYTSDQANSSIEKASLLSAVKMRLLPTDRQGRLRGPTFLKAVKKDLENGMIPCYLAATIGTTPTCAYDNLEELGPICSQFNIWLHVDAAYAGAACVCPEFRDMLKGLEYADSFDFNPHKWLLVNFDCSAFWLKDSSYLTEPFEVKRIYLNQKEMPDPQSKMYKYVADFRDWQIPLGRRFRALKVWFVLRIYGIQGLQKHIRHGVEMTKFFQTLVESDERFEIVVPATLSLIFFRLKGDDDLTKRLIDNLTRNRRVYVTPGMLNDTLVLRFIVCSRFITKKDLELSWKIISEEASKIVKPSKAISGIIRDKGVLDDIQESLSTNIIEDFEKVKVI